MLSELQRQFRDPHSDSPGRQLGPGVRVVIPNLGHPRLVRWDEARPFLMDCDIPPELAPGELLLVRPVVVSRSRMRVQAQALYQRNPPLTVELLVPLDVYVDWPVLVVMEPVDVDSILVD